MWSDKAETFSAHMVDVSPSALSYAVFVRYTSSSSSSLIIMSSDRSVTSLVAVTLMMVILVLSCLEFSTAYDDKPKPKPPVTHRRPAVCM